MYHRIQPVQPTRSDLAPDLISATPRLFAQHLRHLAQFHTPIGADEVLAAVDGRHRLPSRAVLVTFDDGYRDFVEIAWPLLKQYHIPCVLFVPTGFVDDARRLFWWDALWQLLSRTKRPSIVLPDLGWIALASDADRQRAYQVVSAWFKSPALAHTRPDVWATLVRELGVQPELDAGPAVASWTELRQLAADGLCVAAHGRFHALLDQVTAETLRHEVAGSRDDLVRHLGSASPLFSYPNGNVDESAVQAVRGAGFQVAFTTQAGSNAVPTQDAFRLRRDQGRTSLARLVVKVWPPVARLRALRSLASGRRA